eukprot:CAMPEP_0180228634 /NCGR_PEP_ID=MMETSP0987-20121128/24886_1 /TAXON_ID=697907 /ORGANISM="non described non described, Strain CCMP2293" /LENGTH=243 /DNA_ID=CAMNT_0022192877 /DNA_START=9 /DNA_END=737 /DNA_ORIENTATION=-
MGNSASPNTSNEDPGVRNPSSTMLSFPPLTLPSSGGTFCSRGGSASLPLPVRLHSRTLARCDEGEGAKRGDGDRRETGGALQHADADWGSRREPRNGSGTQAHCWSACGRESRCESDARRPSQMFSVASPPPPIEITASVSIIWRHARPSIARDTPAETPEVLFRQRLRLPGTAKHALGRILPGRFSGSAPRSETWLRKASGGAARRLESGGFSEARATLPHVAASGVWEASTEARRSPGASG